MTFLFSWRGLLDSAPVADRPGKRSKAISQLQFPIAASERIAILAEGFRMSKNTRQFGPNELDAIAAYAPQSMVAGLEDAFALQAQPLEHGIVILTSMNDNPLTQRDRDKLWRLFGVPVFEFLRSADSNVIARECECHDGLHVDAMPTLPENWSAEFVKDHCECGLETPRIKALAKVTRKAHAAAA